MKISAITPSVQMYRNTKIQSNNKKEIIKTSTNSNSPSFGLDPVTMGLWLGYLGLYGGICVAAHHQSKRDERERELEIKKIQEDEQRQIQDISSRLKISLEDAKKYHDQYIFSASIPVNKNGGLQKGLNAVMGYEYPKYKLSMDVVAPIVRAQKGIQLEKPVNGVILYGPAGSGKTYVADKMVEHLDYFGVNVKEITFDESNHDANVEQIKETFTNAKNRFEETGKYTVIKLPDDIDGYIVDRNSKDANYRPETMALLKYCENCASKGAVWISTANNPKLVDRALLRPGRTDLKLAIGNMEDYAVSDMIRYALYKNDEVDAAEDFDYGKVLETMEERDFVHTPYEIEFFVERAKHNNIGRDRDVNADDFIATMIEFNEKDFPTLDEESTKKFKDDQEYMETLYSGDDSTKK